MAVGRRPVKPAKSGRRRVAPQRELAAGHVLAKLPSLFERTRGRAFGAQVFRAWLRSERAFRKYKLPSLMAAKQFLVRISQVRKTGSTGQRSGTWASSGFEWLKQRASPNVPNIAGATLKERQSGKWMSWPECGYRFHLCRIVASSNNAFAVTRKASRRTLRAVVSVEDMPVTDGETHDIFKNVVTIEPFREKVGRVQPQWTFIYLHGFSDKGSDYTNYPHYFSIAEAPVRVVLPTATPIGQTCFCDWNVWRAGAWRQKKFNAWFDYASNRGGKSENTIRSASLLEVRARIHSLIRREVERLGGNSKRVIIGGKSQGCCVALDAALTYPEELGGVIGLVGHVLSRTPLDKGKERGDMPLHLFQETYDQEMNWEWISGIVKRVRAAGFNVICKREVDGPYGGGHWIHEIEGEWICSALREIVA